MARIVYLSEIEREEEDLEGNRGSKERFQKEEEKTLLLGWWSHTVRAVKRLPSRCPASDGYKLSCRWMSKETHKSRYTIFLCLKPIISHVYGLILWKGIDQKCPCGGRVKPLGSIRVTHRRKKASSSFTDVGLNSFEFSFGIPMLLIIVSLCMFCSVHNATINWCWNKVVKGAHVPSPFTPRKGCQTLMKNQMSEGFANPNDGGKISIAKSTAGLCTPKHMAILEKFRFIWNSLAEKLHINPYGIPCDVKLGSKMPSSLQTTPCNSEEVKKIYVYDDEPETFSFVILSKEISYDELERSFKFSPSADFFTIFLSKTSRLTARFLSSNVAPRASSSMVHGSEQLGEGDLSTFNSGLCKGGIDKTDLASPQLMGVCQRNQERIGNVCMELPCKTILCKLSIQTAA